MVDPDAPTPDDPKFAYWRHFIQIHIPHSATASPVLTQSPKTLTEYLGPGPKDDSAPRRYLFLLYCEPEGFETGKADVGGEESVQRRSFDIKSWVEKHNLVLMGVNWMRAVGDGWKATNTDESISAS
jgi:phosphatidylethanolamine-binding protein